MRDTAYQSLLKSRRSQLHHQVAQVLEERFPETAETQPELVAHHYTAASLIEQAIPYWERAGQRAIRRSAHVEAIAHLTKGLELLKTLPNTPERIQQELTLQTTLGPALQATKGYAALETGRAYTRARELCQQIGETPQLCPVLYGLWAFYHVRPEHKTAHELAEQLLSLAESQQDTACLVEAHWALGCSLFSLGEIVSARAHLEQSLALYDPQEHRSLAFVYGQDPGMCSLCFAGLASWHLGYPDQALKRSQAAVTLAREVSHPHSLAYALGFAAWCHQLRREGQAAKEQAEAGIALSAEHGVPLFLAMGTIFRGWALSEQGKREEGIAQIHQGLAAWQATGAEWAGPYWFALLAEAYGKGGQAEEGLSVLAQALATVNKTGERFYEAELYRLKGELSLQSKQVETSQDKSAVKTNPEAEAEECFCKAIEIARRQSAKAWELRAVMSLSRLWQRQGKKAEARQLLMEIYNWFTEGFDTKDLQEAKALLEELSH